MAAEANVVEVRSPMHTFPPAPESQALFNHNEYTCVVICCNIYILYINMIYICRSILGFTQKESTELPRTRAQSWRTTAVDMCSHVLCTSHAFEKKLTSIQPPTVYIYIRILIWKYEQYFSMTHVGSL